MGLDETICMWTEMDIDIYNHHLGISSHENLPTGEGLVPTTMLSSLFILAQGNTNMQRTLNAVTNSTSKEGLNVSTSKTSIFAFTIRKNKRIYDHYAFWGKPIQL